MDALFEELARQALLTIKAEDVARFLGKRLPLAHDTQVTSHLGRRYAGLRLKHSFGPASVKLYNRPGGILRLEMTTYDVSFFKHHREVVHQDGTRTTELAAMKKSLYSLRDLAELMQAGVGALQPVAGPLGGARGRAAGGRPAGAARARRGRPELPGFNPLLAEDERGAADRVARRTRAAGGEGTAAAGAAAWLEPGPGDPAAEAAAPARPAAQDRADLHLSSDGFGPGRRQCRVVLQEPSRRAVPARRRPVRDDQLKPDWIRF